MRQSLMNSFDGIYILDLHGNSLKKEKCPDGSKDENVFDIKQGVAIGLFIKHRPEPLEGKKRQKKDCEVNHSEIWGLREKKYDWLLENDIKTTNWKKLLPKSEYYLFIPRDEKLSDIYEKYPKITEVFPLFGVGMTTARDSFVMDRDKNSLLNRIRLFKNSKYSDDELHSFFQINKKKGWSIRKAWNMLQTIPDSDLNRFILPVLYRPFDLHWIFYHDSVVWRTVKRIMRHMMEENIGFLFTRPQSPKYEFSVIVSDKIIDQCAIGNKSAGAGISYVAPLYLYPNKDKKDLFSHKKGVKKQPNFSPEILSAFSEVFKKEPTTEEIFYYIYGVLYSNIFCTKYAEFLKTDFPRVPFTKDYKLFTKMRGYGERLVDLHLLKSKEIDPPTAKFKGKAENKVEKVSYQEKKVVINKDQYFEGITEEVWKYQIGGYQVCNKWLKDRKGRILSLDDIRHYCKVVTAIKHTIEIQKEIDKLYPEIEKETIEFKNPKKE